MQIRITGRPTGPLDPADIHHITRPQLDELSLSGRLAVILDGATDRLAADVLGDAIMPEQVTSDLLDEIDAVEAAAKRLAKKIAKLDESRQTRHTLRAERAERDRLAAEAADAERQAEAVGVLETAPRRPSWPGCSARILHAATRPAQKPVLTCINLVGAIGIEPPAVHRGTNPATCRYTPHPLVK